MENLKIFKSEIIWEEKKEKHGRNIVYETQIIKFNKCISVRRIMYVNGDYKHTDLIHIPLDLLSKIDCLKPTSNIN